MPNQHPILDLIVARRLVAILRLRCLDHAIPLVEALLAGGVHAIEFTLTNPDALSVVAQARRAIAAFDQQSAAIGIGSVRNETEAKQAIDAGAQFLVSPITTEPIIREAKRCGVACMPGAYTPTEIAHGWELGADLIKVFPARGLGPRYIQDVLAPMPYLRLMPTGGIGTDDMKPYFDAGAVAVGVGGNFLDERWISEKRWDQVTQAAARYAQAAARPA
ncbi:MAG: bifunctional 4-hydroxy-2-oxoglutarate aldolase/2-dehydro-3-deoxy-phosphogluconate aldolase [Planctomycetaceae bacterium]